MDTKEFDYDKTKVVLANAKSKRAIHAGSEDSATLSSVRRTAEEDGTVLEASMVRSTEVHEDDVFVFRKMSPDFLEQFQDIQEVFNILYLFCGDMEDACRLKAKTEEAVSPRREGHIYRCCILR